MKEYFWNDGVKYATSREFVESLHAVAESVDVLVSQNEKDDARIAELEAALIGLMGRVVYSSDMLIADCDEMRLARKALDSSE